MIHILCCEEDFAIREKILEISENNFKSLNFEDNNFIVDFQIDINKKLWGKNPFLVIKNFRNENGSKILYEAIKNHNPDLIFVFDEKPDWFIKDLKDLKIIAKIHQIDYKLKAKGRFGKENFRKWANEILEKYQVKLHPITVDKLCDIFINSPSAFLSEIKKLSFYKKNQLITNEELKFLIRQPVGSKAFEIADYLREKNFTKFFQYLKQEIAMMGKPEKEILPLIGLLSSTIFRMFLLKKAKSENRLNEINDMNVYYKNILLSATYKFSENELKYLYNIITTLERRYKKYQIKVSDIPEEMFIGMSAVK